MANAYRCTHGSDAPEPLLAQLPESQAGTARHKCAPCAYSRGRAAGARRQHDKAQMEHCQHGNAAPAAILADLQDSQAGPGVQRHKCCICAFAQGFDATVALSEIPHADELSEPEKFHEGAVKAHHRERLRTEFRGQTTLRRTLRRQVFRVRFSFRKSIRSRREGTYSRSPFVPTGEYWSGLRSRSDQTPSACLSELPRHASPAGSAVFHQ